MSTGRQGIQERYVVTRRNVNLLFPVQVLTVAFPDSVASQVLHPAPVCPPMQNAQRSLQSRKVNRLVCRMLPLLGLRLALRSHRIC